MESEVTISYNVKYMVQNTRHHFLGLIQNMHSSFVKLRKRLNITINMVSKYFTILMFS